MGTKTHLSSPRIEPGHSAPSRAALGLVGLVGLGALVLTLPGCVATAEGMPSRGVVVSGPPPAPLPEARPQPPAKRTAWIGGYWHWTGMHYAWIPGHWDAAPTGAQWVAPRYFQQGGQYLYEAGTWNRGNALR